MDPGTAFAAVSATVKAVTEINHLIQLIGDEKLTADDSEYYRKWLEVAMLAIRGLEGEYEQILQQAWRCDVADSKQRNDLTARINAYINGEHLRPKLKEALGHLDAGQNVLKEHAERLLLWPKTRQSREEALMQYTQLVGDLHGYLGSLGDYTGESAGALKELRLLLKGVSGPQEEFHALVDLLQKYRDKNALFQTTGQAAAVTSSLRAAFR